MIRTCPKCLDYYADEALMFCLTDGAPLVAVDPQSDAWREGVRVIEEKENRLSRQERKRKWRRGLMRAATMLLTAMVLFVIVMNGVVYLNPKPEEEGAQDEPLAKNATDEPNAPSPKSIPGKEAPAKWSTVTPQPTATPIATEVIAPTPRPTPFQTPAQTPTPFPTQTPWSDATPRPTATPITITIVTATPTPTPVWTQTPVLSSPPPPTPTPTVTQRPAETTCSDADRARERETIISSYGGRWRRNIEGERQKIIAENAPDGAANAEAVLGEIEYATTFIMSCRSAAVILRYVWQVRTNFNGKITSRPIAKSKRVVCTKVAGVWLCR
ncbi:MAG: hypothetical protein ICV60_03065 [Pyrinomonadaceae bacterium]|nr:hypothetical protein [Pyrinomonadaceae bacterium]